MRQRTAFDGVLLLSCLAAAACGNVTAGGVGETEVYMTGDGGSQPAPSARPSRAVMASDADRTAPAAGLVLLGGLEGDLDVTASFFLRGEDGTLVPLTTEGPVSVTLDLAGGVPPRVVKAPVPAGSYDAVTVRFADVTADVTGGLEIDGLPFKGIVDVDLGGPSLDVTKPLSIVVEDDDLVQVLVDLNVDVWVPLLHVLTHIVAGADFAGAVQVGEL